MNADGHDAGKDVFLFAKDLLEDLSVEELRHRIEALHFEISRCEREITARHATNDAAESVFRK